MIVKLVLFLVLIRAIFAEIFLNFKSSVKIFLTVYSSKFSSAACSCLFTFSYIRWVFMHLSIPSFLTSSHLPLNFLCHSNIAVLFIVVSTYTVIIIPTVSFQVLLNLTQNLVLTSSSDIVSDTKKVCVYLTANEFCFH